MKIAVLIARILLGLVFFIFGLDKFFHLIPAQMSPGVASQFADMLSSTHYMWIVGLIEVVCGLLLLINRYIPLALTLIGPVIVNIILFDVLMAPSGLPVGVVVVVLWFLVFFQHRAAFAGIFAQNA